MTWPVRHSTGLLQPWAVHSAAEAFSTPGPGTTANAAGLPVAAEYPNAM